VALGWAFLYISVVLLLVTLFPSWSRRHRDGWIRHFGRSVLFLLGVDLVVHERAKLPKGPYLVFVNHVNLIDLPVFACTWPNRGCVVYKREFHRIPFLGRTMRALGMIPIDRSDQEAGRQSLALAGLRVRKDDAVLMIAPEGTRSHDGRLGPFKKGPFHLAIQCQVPVVPMVMHGAERIFLPSSPIPRPGRVEVEYLDPLDPSNWRSDHLEETIQEVRNLFLERLGQLPGSRAEGDQPASC